MDVLIERERAEEGQRRWCGGVLQESKQSHLFAVMAAVVRRRLAEHKSIVVQAELPSQGKYYRAVVSVQVLLLRFSLNETALDSGARGPSMRVGEHAVFQLPVF